MPSNIIGRVTLGFLQQLPRDSTNPSASIAGDINHCPLDDPEIEWERVQPYNRTSRCLPRASEDEPWRGNRIVGQIFRDGEFTDVGGYFEDRQATGKAGLLRVDQAHVTPALRPALRSYQRVDPGPASDHYGISWELDLAATNRKSVV